MWIDPLSRRLLRGAGIVPTSNGRGPVVLMYHSIAPNGSKPKTTWDVTAKNFTNQLQLLRHEGWHAACVRDLLHADSLPPRTVVITLDDGYADNFEYAFRMLLGHKMRGTWFIVTHHVGELSSWPGSEMPVKSMLNEKQLVKMAAAGMEIGAHTCTHPRLPELSAQDVWDEVSSSKSELENILGQSVISFAYPYGDFNKDCIEAVKKAGYKVACTARPGWFGSEKDLLQVRRVAVFAHDSLSSFARKLAFADNDVGWERMRAYAAGRIKSRLLPN